MTIVRILQLSNSGIEAGGPRCARDLAAYGQTALSRTPTLHKATCRTKKVALRRAASKSKPRPEA